MAIRRMWVVALTLVLLMSFLTAFAFVRIIHPRILLAQQISNHVRCHGVEAFLEKFYESAGRYPSQLKDALPVEKHAWTVDGWGHDFHYESDAEHFVLASYGRDGRPDGTDYWVIRNQGIQESICGSHDADEVVSDRGWHRVCGK